MWFFYTPDLAFGEDALDYFEQIEGKKCFIVTDPGIIKVGLLDILTEKLKATGKEWQVFSEVEPDPHEDTIYKAAKQAMDYEPDIIIGLGGGSSIDASKGVWVLYERPDFKTVDEIHPFQRLKTGVKSKLVAIPTTSGTGAETTPAVVVTRVDDEGNHSKLEQINRDCIPSIAIVDPIFPKGLPKKLTTATAFDAIGHCMEGYVSTWQNDFSDAFAIHAVRMIFEYLPRAVVDGSDMEAREKVHNAATMAGMSFGNSQVHIGHGIAHASGAILHAPHGNMVGLTIPFVMEYVINNTDDPKAANKYAVMAKALGVANWDDEPKAAALKLVAKIRALQQEVGLPTTLQDLGVSKEDFDAKVDDIVNQCLQSGAVTMTPRSVTAADFKKILEHIFSGDPVDF